VIEPLGVLPQGAWKIDNTMAIADNEILIDVSALNVDAASFTQIKAEAGRRRRRAWATSSGHRGPARQAAQPGDGLGRHAHRHGGGHGQCAGRQDGPAAVGDKIATLVSLSLTPLRIDQIRAVHLDRDQIEIDGQAISVRDGPVRQAARRHPRKDGAGHSGRGRRTGADRAPGACRATRWW
jgi:L-erythro-3,5-diaminohexanoate dehydrogenase